MNELLLGATAMAYAGLAVIFGRFFAQSRDRLFAIFAAAFGILAVNRAALALINRGEAHTSLYVVRLAAFGLILWAIVDKNRSQ